MRSSLWRFLTVALALGACTLITNPNEITCTENGASRCEANTLVVCVDGVELRQECGEAVCLAEAGICGGGPLCGNGTTDPGEECDDGNANNSDDCTDLCSAARCGDGSLQLGNDEQCDDGNTSDGDGCSSVCEFENCGDGNEDEGEECDDGNAINTDACLNDCADASCGDGFIRAGVEQCDDTNASNNDACTNSCQNARCGDGFVRTGIEQCDDANNSNNDLCTNVCQNARCGDGFIRAGAETCDDGNTTNGDGCSAACQLENNLCRNGVLNAGEQCDDGNNNNNDACTNVCQNARCGDGIIRNGVETCDDGNTTNGDGCSSVCAIENNNSCAHDFCDQGAALVSGCDPCVTTICAADSFCCTNTWDSQCVAQVASLCGISCNAGPVCGNGAIEAGETCDDGNVANGDGCSSACLIEGNGSCAAPFTLGLGTVTGNTTGFLNIINPSCQQAGSPDIAFRFTSPNTATRTFTLTSNNDQGIILHNACPGTELGCIDAVAGNAATPETETITLNMTAGQTIFVFVGSFTAITNGPFTLVIQ
jgi:cysteine-rich repeat protein